jgi:hypothetical protein
MLFAVHGSYLRKHLIPLLRLCPSGVRHGGAQLIFLFNLFWSLFKARGDGEPQEATSRVVYSVSPPL